MNDNDLKLFYNSTKLKAKISFLSGICLNNDNCPADLFARVISKMEQEKNQGNIAFYVVFEEQFKKFWRAVRNELLSGGDKELPLEFTLAAGAPNFPGLIIEAAQDEKTSFLLSFEAPAKILKSWNFDWIKTFVTHFLKTKNATNLPNIAQLHGAWLRACHGQKIEKLPISSFSPPVQLENKSHLVLGNKSRRELLLVVNDSKVFTDKIVMTNLLKNLSPFSI